MPRALWTGSISFGLVNVPVQLVSAARDLDYHFNELHEKDKVRIEQRRFCSKEDAEVMYEEVAHSYDLDGKQVVVTDAELGSVEPRKTRTIDIEAFVELAEVDPIYFDHPYLIVPAGESEGTMRAYRLLIEVMGRTERAALGRFVMRTKEYLAAIRAREGGLTLSTMLFHDEVRPTKPIAGGGKKKPANKELDQALALIEGAFYRLGSGALRGLLPRAPAPRDRGQAEAPDDRGAAAGEGAAAGARPDGRAPARPRQRQGGPGRARGRRRRRKPRRPQPRRAPGAR